LIEYEYKYDKVGNITNVRLNNKDVRIFKYTYYPSGQLKTIKEIVKNKAVDLLNIPEK